MDAAAYLKKQGWRGTGHSLDHTDRGIKKPLQISKKVDALGVGLNKYAAVSDQWWMRAYDQGLKDLGSGKETALATAQKHGVNRGGLYARFVKGGGVPGTIGQQSSVEESTAAMAGALNSNAQGDRSRDKQPLTQASSHESYNFNDAPERTQAAAHQGRETAAQVRLRRRRERDQRAKDDLKRKLKRAGFNQDAIERPKAELDHVRHRVKGFVDEAMRMGVIPPRRSGKPVRTRAIPPTEKDMSAVLELAKLPAWKAHKNPKSEKIEREKIIRELKRAVIRYLETVTPNNEELEAAKGAEDRLKAENRAAREMRREKLRQEKEGRLEAKKESRARKRAAMRATLEQSRQSEAPARQADGFKESADEVNPGADAIDDPTSRIGIYPTSGEKRARKFQAEAIEQGVSVAEIQKQHEAKSARRSQEKQMELYRKNAAKKGLSLAEYMEQKRAKKEEEEARAAADEGAETATKKSKRAKPTVSDSEDVQQGNDLGFVVDTTGDASIMTDPNAPVPLDPSLWKDKVVKDLPRNVRKARRDWMALRRADRKGTTSTKTQKKLKGTNKVEAREAFVKEILRLSRDANRKGELAASVTVNGIQNVPVLKVEKTPGGLGKAEVARARTLARKMIKLDKKERSEKRRGRK